MEEKSFQPNLDDVALILSYDDNMTLCEKIALKRALMNCVDETTKIRIQMYFENGMERLEEFEKKEKKV